MASSSFIPVDQDSTNSIPAQAASSDDKKPLSEETPQVKALEVHKASNVDSKPNSVGDSPLVDKSTVLPLDNVVKDLESPSAQTSSTSALTDSTEPKTLDPWAENEPILDSQELQVEEKEKHREPEEESSLFGKAEENDDFLSGLGTEKKESDNFLGSVASAKQPEDNNDSFWGSSTESKEINKDDFFTNLNSEKPEEDEGDFLASLSSEKQPKKKATASFSFPPKAPSFTDNDPKTSEEDDVLAEEADDVPSNMVSTPKRRPNRARPLSTAFLFENVEQPGDDSFFNGLGSAQPKQDTDFLSQLNNSSSPLQTVKEDTSKEAEKPILEAAKPDIASSFAFLEEDELLPDDYYEPTKSVTSPPASSAQPFGSPSYVPSYPLERQSSFASTTSANSSQQQIPPAVPRKPQQIPPKVPPKGAAGNAFDLPTDMVPKTVRKMSSFQNPQQAYPFAAQNAHTTAPPKPTLNSKKSFFEELPPIPKKPMSRKTSMITLNRDVQPPLGGGFPGALPTMGGPHVPPTGPPAGPPGHTPYLPQAPASASTTSLNQYASPPAHPGASTTPHNQYASPTSHPNASTTSLNQYASPPAHPGASTTSLNQYAPASPGRTFNPYGPSAETTSRTASPYNPYEAPVAAQSAPSVNPYSPSSQEHSQPPSRASSVSQGPSPYGPPALAQQHDMQSPLSQPAQLHRPSHSSYAPVQAAHSSTPNLLNQYAPPKAASPALQPPARLSNPAGFGEMPADMQPPPRPNPYAVSQDSLSSGVNRNLRTPPVNDRAQLAKGASPPKPPGPIPGPSSKVYSEASHNVPKKVSEPVAPITALEAFPRRQFPIFHWTATDKAVSVIPPSISFGGASTVTEIKVQSVQSIFKDNQFITKFPFSITTSKGGQKNKKKDLEQWIDGHIKEGESKLKENGFSTSSRQADRLTLWKILLNLLQADSSPSQPSKTFMEAVRKTLDPSVQVETQELDTFAPAVDIYQKSLHRRDSSSGNAGSSRGLKTEDINRLVDLLKVGQREAALKHALDQHLWAHALIMASSLGPTHWIDAVFEFVREEIRPFPSQSARDLALMYRTFSGAGADAVSEVLPGQYSLTLQEPTPGPQLSSSLSNWNSTVSMLFSNSSPMNLETVNILSSLLLKSGYVEASHVCHVLFGTGVFGPSTGSKASFELLGSDPTLPGGFGRDVDSILLSLAFEFYRVTTDSPAQTTPYYSHLVLHKLNLVSYLIDCGHITEAQGFFDTVSSIVKAAKGSVYSPDLLNYMSSVGRRLNVGQDESSSWIGRPKLDKMLGHLDKSFSKFVSGEDSAKSAPTAEQDGIFKRLADTPMASRQGSVVNLAAMPKTSAPPSRTQSYVANSYAALGQEAQHQEAPSQPPSAPGSVVPSDFNNFSPPQHITSHTPRPYSPSYGISRRGSEVAPQGILPLPHSSSTTRSMGSNIAAQDSYNPYAPAAFGGPQDSDRPYVDGLNSVSGASPVTSQFPGNPYGMPPSIPPNATPASTSSPVNPYVSNTSAGSSPYNPTSPGAQSTSSVVYHEPASSQPDIASSSYTGYEAVAPSPYDSSRPTSTQPENAGKPDPYAPALSQTSTPSSNPYAPTSGSYNPYAPSEPSKPAANPYAAVDSTPAPSQSAQTQSSSGGYNPYGAAEPGLPAANPYAAAPSSSQNIQAPSSVGGYNPYGTPEPNQANDTNDSTSHASLPNAPAPPASFGGYNPYGSAYGSEANMSAQTEQDSKTRDDLASEASGQQTHSSFAPYEPPQYGYSSDHDTPGEPFSDYNSEPSQMFNPMGSSFMPSPYSAAPMENAQSSQSYEEERDDDEIEDLGFANNSFKKKEDSKEKQEDDKESEKDQQKGKKGGWFSWIRKGDADNKSKAVQIKFGDEMALVYDPVLKRYVNKNAPKEDLKPAPTPPPPPPSMGGGSSAGGMGMPAIGGMPPMGGIPPASSAPPAMGNAPPMGGPSPLPPSSGPPSMGGAPSPSPGPPRPSIPTSGGLDDLLAAVPAPGAGRKPARRNARNRYVDIMSQQQQAQDTK